MTNSPLPSDWRPLLMEICRGLGLDQSAADRVEVTGEGTLPSCFPVTGLAVASIAAASLAVADLVSDDSAPSVMVDRRLASLWFGWSIQPVGWTLPPAWDAVAGDYQARDGWIRLHTNAPAHRLAALSVLACAPDRETVAAAVATWAADALEQAVVDAGGCAAVMRSADAWRRHPQGRAVAADPLFVTEGLPGGKAGGGQVTSDRPLDGVRVLDLTRILAGPIATRFLAGYGADVLRIDPPGWDEPSVAPEVTLGKTCARLDLRDGHDRAVFEQLLAQADVLVHGYRPGALEALGYGEAARQAICPGLIDVSLNAYGRTGPWAGRRGFDSLVQMSCGIAEAGRVWKGAEQPVPLPVQALDHATGYLMAAAVVRGLRARRKDGTGWRATLSLARTAKLLMDHRSAGSTSTFAPAQDADYSDDLEQTVWGVAHRLKPPVAIDDAPIVWDRPATTLGSGQPAWRS